MADELAQDGDMVVVNGVIMEMPNNDWVMTCNPRALAAVVMKVANSENPLASRAVMQLQGFLTVAALRLAMCVRDL